MQPGPMMPPNMAPPPMAPQPARKGMPVWVIILIVVVVGGVMVLGVLSALAIFGVRKYMASAKTAEAKNTVGAISRAAAAAYERAADASGAAGTLCRSATPVPVAVPRGNKYVSATADWDGSDPAVGWKCLKFEMIQPIYYQYHYNQGSGYVAASTAPGPTGFEAAAVGDLDGDRTNSLFSRVGKPDASGTLVVSTQLYIENEFE